MDTRFLGQPHEWDPRRLYSQTGADWQYRVDFDRLRKERLEKLRASMKTEDLGALVLFAGANIRYATASYQGNWKYNINIRYAVVTHTGEPVLFETAGSDLHCGEIDLPWMEGRIRPAITWQWAEGAVPYMAGRMAESVVDVLKEQGVAKEKIGIDNFDMPSLEAFQKTGIKIVNGWPAVSRARVVKTRDEIELLKQASSIGDAAMWKIKYEWLKPGVREREIEAIFRGEEVADAIRIYYSYQVRQRNLNGDAALPTSMDQLLEGVSSGTKKVQILRASAARDPLSESGEWKLVRPRSSQLADFQRSVMLFAGNIRPATNDPQLKQVELLMAPLVLPTNDLPGTGLSSAGDDNSSGPFIGVVTDNKSKSIINYYGIDQHDGWIFTPLFR